MKQKKQGDLSVLDRYVKFNFQLIKGEITASLAAAVLAGLAVYMDALVGSLLSLCITFIIVICMISCIKKLFYNTVFADGAAVYNMLPVSYAEMVVTKVLAAVFCVYIPYAVYVLIMSGFIPSPKDYDITLFMFLSGSKLPAAATAMLNVAVNMAGYVCQTFGEMPLIFLGITVYNTLPQARRTGAGKLATIAAVYALIAVPGLTGRLLTHLQVNAAVIYAATLALSLAIGAAACMATRARLEKKYFLD